MLDIKPLLRNSNPHPAGSNKNSLNIAAYKLATSSQDLVIQLLKMVDSALARINIAQLSSVTVDADNKQIWLFDIPVTNNKEHELVQAKIYVDKECDDEQSTRVWTVQLAMDVSPLGPLQSTLTICDNKVQAHFNSNSPAQQSLIEENINILKQNFANAGLLVEKIICTQGLKEDLEQDKLQPLLDEEA